MAIPTAMTSQRVHFWLVSDDSAGLYPVGAGTTSTESEAWTQAVGTGLNALLSGAIRNLAIAVDDEIPSLGYCPGRSHDGQLDPIHVEQDLAELLAHTIDDLIPRVKRRLAGGGCG